MINIAYFLILSFFNFKFQFNMIRLLAILICAVFTFSTAYAQDAKKKKETVTFFVEGMDCANCVKKIEKNIAFEKGVTDLKCDLSTRTAAVTYRADKTSKTKLASAFKKIGMEATPVDNGAGCPVDPAKKK
ncbi:heavy metal-associated domain protein [Parabacteroides johnsonii DSM 18315]|nr:heavy metal-associated domain protein [Parabacteroides johnsonii DSM 18315]